VLSLMDGIRVLKEGTSPGLINMGKSHQPTFAAVNVAIHLVKWFDSFFSAGMA
jgi:hypothetical protein